jgi:hypothetical protein
MAIAFPANPGVGATYTYNSIIWTYDGTRWNKSPTTSPAALVTVSDNAPLLPTVGALWLDSTVGEFSVYSGTGWTDIGGGAQGYVGSVGYAGSQGPAGGYTGSRGYVGSFGYTGSASTALGFTGSTGPAGGYTGSVGYAGSTAYVGSAGYLGSFGYTGSIGFTGSTGAGYTGSTGYVGSLGYTGSIGFTGSSIAGYTNSALTISTGLSGTSFNGSAPITIAIDSSVTTNAGTQTLTNKTITGLTSTSTIVDGGASSYAIGFKAIPQSSTASGNLVLTDAGKHVYVSASVTVPPNSTAAFDIGTVVTIMNSSGSAITVTQGAGVTLRLSGTTSTGNRTLAVYGLCSVIKAATNTWYISGSGVS